jgi:hypothetical protein
MANFVSVAQEFVRYYYQVFDTNREGLSGLYSEASMLTFESECFQGVNAIMDKLRNLGFQKIQHEVHTLDSQPGPVPESIVVLVSGTLVMDETNIFKFSQVFQLLKTPGGQYYCHNDMFKLNLG